MTDTIERPFGLWTASAMVIGSMVGAGIFALPGAIAPYGWSSAVAWLAAGAGALVIARVITGLTASRPLEPSVVTISGDILGLLAGRMMAWIYWVTIVASLPVLGMTAAAYALHVFPAAPQGAWPQVIGGTLVLLVLAAINLRGVRAAGVTQVVTTLLKLLPLALAMLITLWLVLADPETFTRSAAPPVEPASLSPALGILFFAMLSFESAALMSERVRDPGRTVPRAMYLGISVVLVLYIVVSTGIIAAIPQDELRASGAPIALFVERYLGAGAGNAVALFAAISAIGCLNGLTLLLGEVPLGMARDGQLPERMARPSARGVAAGPLLAGVGLGLLLMLGSVTGMGEAVLDFLLRVTTATSIWFYIFICAAALVAGQRRVSAVVSLAFCLWVIWGTGLEAGALGIALTLVGVPLHFIIGGRTTPRGTAPA